MEGAVSRLPEAAPLLGIDEPWRATVLAFLVEKAGRTGSRRTVEVYCGTVARFISEVRDPAIATPLDVHRFAYGPGPRVRFPSPATIAVRLAAVGGLYDFAMRMELISRNPAANVRRPVVARSPARGLSVEEVRCLLAVIPSTRSGLEDRALALTAVLTGLRRTELAQMHVIDPRTGERPRYVVRTKGGLVRIRELPGPAYEAIQRARPAHDARPGSPRPAFSMADATFYAHLRGYGEAAGLGWITPHVLRHTAAKLRRRCGASIEDVCALLGHQSIATTAIYLRQVESDGDNGWAVVSAALGIETDLGPSAELAAPHPRYA